jgi:outer membrane protein assembly factor BamB
MIRASAGLGLVLVVVGLAAGAAADEPAVAVPGESRATALRFAEARKRIAERRWGEALEELQGILDTNPADLVAVDRRRSVQARRLVHAAIAALPPQALRLYRGRVDPRAARWLQQGLTEGDPRLVRKVVDDAFCSRPAEKALDLLGDRAFERGRFDDALAWWRLLVPPLSDGPPGDPVGGALHYPGPQTDPARVRAKQLLARLFRAGRTPLWDDDLKAYRAAHGKAEGTLAGHTGSYADTLATVAARHDKEGPADPDWATFGGDASRGLVVPAEGDVLDHMAALCRDGPAWRYSLEDHQPLAEPPPPLAAGRDVVGLAALARTLSFHPVITRTEVLVADGRRVTAFDLRRGTPREWYDAGHEDGARPAGRLPAAPGLRFTLTTAGGRLYARLGGPVLRSPARAGDAPGAGRARDEDDPSVIACLAMRPDEGADRLRWSVRALPESGAGGRRDPAFFEGTPLAEAGSAFVALAHLAGQRAVTSIECYAAEGVAGGTAPLLGWRREICETRQPRSEQTRYQHLLTLAGPVLTYCTHSGLVVGLDPATGQPAWALRYPHRNDEADDRLLEIVPTPEQRARARDLAPCVYADGRLYVAPADSDVLLCLDPATGEVVWQREQVHVVHLLGVGQGRLIFQTMTGLRAVGAADGTDAAGWLRPGIDPLSVPGCPSMGRGLLLGDLVLWPCAVPRTGGRPGFVVQAVRQADGSPAGDPTLLHRLPVGNLAYAHGCLAVADQTTLSVFLPPRLRLEDRRGAVLRQPQSATAWLDLARAETDAGHLDAARRAYRRVELLAESSPQRPASRRLTEQARCGLQAVLLEAGRQALSAGAPAAQGLLAEAADIDVPAESRLRVLTTIADLWEGSGQPSPALAALERILACPQLRSLPMPDSRRLPQPAAERVAAGARRLMAAAGDAVAADVERRARACWEGASPERRADAAGRLADEFPHARLTRFALRDVAGELEKADRPGTAASAWRRLLELRVQGEERATALEGLTRCLQRQGCPEATGYTCQRPQGENGTSTPAAHFAPPLRQTWHGSLASDEVFLPGMDPTAGACLVLTGRSDGEVIARRFASGEITWRSRLPFRPALADAYADVLLIGGAGGLAAIRREDGGREWSIAAARRHTLTGFRACGGRVFFFEDGCRLYALDAQTGRTLWAADAPGAGLGMAQGRFFPAYHANSEAVIVQTGVGSFQILDAASGRPLGGGPASTDPWPDAPVMLDRRTVCVVPTSRQVLSVALPGGTDTSTTAGWHYDLPGATVGTGELPRVFAHGDVLLLVTPLNIGYRLDRLDRTTGKLVWDHPWLLQTDQLDASSWALDGSAVYYSGDGVLAARALQDGRLLWQRPLPGAWPWAVRCVGEALLVYPDPRPRTRFRFQWAMASLQYLSGQPLAAGAPYPVLICDCRTGRLVQRLDLPFRPRGGARLDGGAGLTLWTSAAAVPTPPSDAANLALYLGPRGAVVALAGDLWGLAGNSP